MFLRLQYMTSSMFVKQKTIVWVPNYGFFLSVSFFKNIGSKV
jgi:hypothetical protein